MKRKSKPKKAETFAPANVVDLDALAEKLFNEARAQAEVHGIEVLLVAVTPTGDWRAKWGQMNLDKAAWFVFRLLTAIQRMLP